MVDMTDTAALQAILDRGGDVVIPKGRYTTGPLFVRNGTTLTFEDGTELVATTDESEYPLVETRIAGIWMKAYPAILNVIDGYDVTIQGHATIDGSGPYWWDKYWGSDGRGGYRGRYDAAGLRWAADYDCLRPRNLLVENSENVRLRGIVSRDSGFWNIHICYSRKVTVEDITIESGDAHGPSTDGIDIDSSSDVIVRRCTASTNDDSICIKSGRGWDGWHEGRACHDVLIEDCTVLSGFGITIGSEVSGGVHGITIRNIRYRGTDCGFRIKSSRSRKGYIRGIDVSDLDMEDVKYPIHIFLDWNPAYSCCTLPEGYGAEIPEHWQKLLREIPEDVPDTAVSDIRIRKVRSACSDGYNGISRAFNIEGYENQPIRNLSIEDSSFMAKEFGIISCVSGLSFRNTDATATGKPVRENDEYDNR